MQDSEKLEALYRIYEKPLYHIAFAVLHQHEQAEDAVHDAFCKIVRHLHKLGEPDAPETKAYMVSVIRSIACSQYRSNQRESARTIRMDDESAGQIADPENVLERRMQTLALRERLEQLLGRLAEADRNLVLLHCRDGLTFLEIGERLHISEQTARKRYERARRRMLAGKGEI